MIMRFVFCFALVFTLTLNMPMSSAFAEDTAVLESEEAVSPNEESEQVETEQVEIGQPEGEQVEIEQQETDEEAAAKAAKEEKDAKAKAQAEEMKSQSQLLRKLTDDIKDLTESLDPPSRAHFYMIYNNHNLISTVKRVREDVSGAVNKCSESNPEIEERIRARYAQWEEAVNEKIESAKGNIDNMTIAQDYAPEEKIRSIMKMSDDLRDETMAKMERIPVTTLEACEYLLNKMDETQANMVNLLEATLVSVPQAIHETLEDDRNVGADTP
ncbi:MAG: hypothetical protein ACK4VI_03110 [Alphaproteobacteria bacterium]